MSETFRPTKKKSRMSFLFSFGGRGRKKPDSRTQTHTHVGIISNPNIQHVMTKKFGPFRHYHHIQIHIIAEICIINIGLGKCLRFLLSILLNCTRSSHFFPHSSEKPNRHNARCEWVCVHFCRHIGWLGYVVSVYKKRLIISFVNVWAHLSFY